MVLWYSHIFSSGTITATNFIICTGVISVEKLMERETFTTKFSLKFLNFLTGSAYSYTRTSTVFVQCIHAELSVGNQCQEKIFGIQELVLSVVLSQVCIARFHHRNRNNKINGKYHILELRVLNKTRLNLQSLHVLLINTF